MIGATTRAILPRYPKSSRGHGHHQRRWKVQSLALLGTATAASAMIQSTNGTTNVDHRTEHEHHVTSGGSKNYYCGTPIRRWNTCTHRNGVSIPFPQSLFLNNNNNNNKHKAQCEAATSEIPAQNLDDNNGEPVMTEEEEYFLDKLEMYRQWLEGMRKVWAISSPASIKWPLDIPQEQDISALEMDLQNYLKGGQISQGQDLEFRIASYYLFRERSVEKQRKGFQIVKRLAVDGHSDGLCLYGMVWNHGGVAGIEAKPHLAVKYWRQAADAGHLASMYELAVALYMGDGTVEDPRQAVQYFIKAADLGHSGAAYLLADCYLDGVGVERSRGKALEWLMMAAEMGHRQAQRRAEAILTGELVEPEQEDESLRWQGETTIAAGSRRNDWYREVSLERRFTIGGGSRNPLILFRRKTAVAESRQSET